MQKVTTLLYSPTKCLFCERTDGEFIDVEVDQFVVATADGPKAMDGHAYVCVGSEEIPGCAMQIGRLAGCLDPSASRGLEAQLAEAQAEVIILQNQPPEMKVVAVSELELNTPHVADAVRQGA